MEDEKQIELDALQSIYLDQFKLTDNPNAVEIVILPNPDAGEDANQVGLVLEVTYTDNYPNEVPRLGVRSYKGIGSKQCRELLEKIQEQAAELVGMQMVYSLSQTLKDWLDEQNMDELSKQKEKEKAKEEIEMEKESQEYRMMHQQHKDGTACTKDSFKIWFEKFLDKHPEKPKLLSDERRPNRQTGRRIFETMSLAAIAQMAANELNQQRQETSAAGQAVDWDLFDAEAENLDDLE